MSGISTGIGLISGINTADLIDQLIAIERRPVDRLTQRVTRVDGIKAAFARITARLLAMRNTGIRFTEESFFSVVTAGSSNEDALGVSAVRGAPPGTYTFRVHQLASNHQMVSRAFADADRMPLGAGTLTFERARARVNPGTSLDALNGGAGVRRGVIRITDRSGATADVDLSYALTVDDVVRAINETESIDVRARVTSLDDNGATGDRIVIEDLTGAEQSNLIVADVGGGFTAGDLGIRGDAAADRIDGSDLVRLTDSTTLSALNDGNGVDRFITAIGDDFTFAVDDDGNGSIDRRIGISLAGDLARNTNRRLEELNSGAGVRLGVIRITDRTGKSVEVDLAEEENGVPIVRTAADVVQRINDATDAAGVKVRVTVISSHLQILDETGAEGEGAGNLKVEDVSGHAAADLGIEGDVEANVISGQDVYRIETLGDVLRAIQYAAGNEDGAVSARVAEGGNGLVLETALLRGKVTVEAGEVGAARSNAAYDLGFITDEPFDALNPLHTRDLVSGLNTTLLSTVNGGRGVEQLGLVEFADRSGQTAQVDLAGASTLGDVVDLINQQLAAAGVGLTASVNDSGNGLQFTDHTGGDGDIRIADRPGSTAAADLGIAGVFADGDVAAGSNLQKQYIARSTRLATLNGGSGIGEGEFRITTSDGKVASVNIASNVTTIGQVIDRINAAGVGSLTARINDTGDGILIEDIAGGEAALRVENVGNATVATKLRLAGQTRPDDDPKRIDGSYEIRIEADANDTLNDIRDKINAAGAGVSAAVVSTGGAFSLTLASDVTGRAGEMVIDAGGLDLGLRTMARAQDALVTFGGESNAAVLLSNSSNTIENVVEGVTLNLLDTSDEDIVVTIAQDIDGIVEAIQAFVDDYNDVQGDIDDQTRFDPETFAKGALFGDSTVNVIRTRLHAAISSQFDAGVGALQRLHAIGIRVGANNRLEFDAETFRDAYEENPELVEQLFTADDTGFGDVMVETLDGLTGDVDGVITRKNELLDGQRDILSDRIAQLNVLIDKKRLRLERQFQGLETALANLQRQQTALNQLQAALG
ncbi:MAG: hypothetical protein C4547_15745 [Phycisphaerales bacterium]|nr:MAG: hypothetical protein C4547_15745 [Phycisphaerales bacterium]